MILRAAGTMLLAATVSGLIAGMVQVQIGIMTGAGEELIAAMFIEVTLVIVAAAMFFGVLVIGKGTKPTDRLAVALCLVIVAGIAILASFDPTAIKRDAGLLLAIGAPALVTILVQWWFARRWLRKANRTAHVEA